jgi:hypothetical protein
MLNKIKNKMYKNINWGKNYDLDNSLIVIRL